MAYTPFTWRNVNAPANADLLRTSANTAAQISSAGEGMLKTLEQFKAKEQEAADARLMSDIMSAGGDEQALKQAFASADSSLFGGTAKGYQEAQRASDSLLTNALARKQTQQAMDLALKQDVRAENKAAQDLAASLRAADVQDQELALARDKAARDIAKSFLDADIKTKKLALDEKQYADAAAARKTESDLAQFKLNEAMRASALQQQERDKANWVTEQLVGFRELEGPEGLAFAKDALNQSIGLNLSSAEQARMQPIYTRIAQEVPIDFDSFTKDSGSKTLGQLEAFKEQAISKIAREANMPLEAATNIFNSKARAAGFDAVESAVKTKHTEKTVLKEQRSQIKQNVGKYGGSQGILKTVEAANPEYQQWQEDSAMRSKIMYQIEGLLENINGNAAFKKLTKEDKNLFIVRILENANPYNTTLGKGVDLENPYDPVWTTDINDLNDEQLRWAYGRFMPEFPALQKSSNSGGALSRATKASREAEKKALAPLIDNQ